MKVYAIVHAKIYADPEVAIFTDPDNAIECAKRVAVDFAKYEISNDEDADPLEALEEKEIPGWLYYVKYNTEDYIFVEEKEVYETLVPLTL